MKRFSEFLAVGIVMACVSAAESRGGSVYVAHLDGPSESPPNVSPGTGSARVELDTIAHTLRVQFDFSGLLGTTTAAHIHAPTSVPGSGTVGVATQVPRFEGFPTGVKSGTYDHTFDTSDVLTWNPAYITLNGGTALGAEAAFALALSEGKAYLNIHTDQFPGGEIRGFLMPIPEPSTLTMGGIATLVGWCVARRRPKQATAP